MADMKTVLVLESDEIVPVGVELRVTVALPHDHVAMFPERAVFDDADDWWVVDFVIGNRSLRPEDWRAAGFNDNWPVSAAALAAALAVGRFKLETIQTRMNVEMRVRPQRPGLRFRCVLSGRACVYTPWRQYRRSKIAELRHYVPGETLEGVSIADVDRKAGSPREGDMIARNPKNHADQWLVAAAYFADNFEPLEPSEIVLGEEEMDLDDLGGPEPGEPVIYYDESLPKRPPIYHDERDFPSCWALVVAAHGPREVNLKLVPDWTPNQIWDTPRDELRRFALEPGGELRLNVPRRSRGGDRQGTWQAVQ